MSKNVEKIKKLFRETLINGIFLDKDAAPREIIDRCEEQGKFYSYKGLFIAPCRTIIDESDYIRIIFVIKETDQGKVQDVEKVMALISDLESALTYVDKCNQTKGDNFIYIDVLKKLIQVE